VIGGIAATVGIYGMNSWWEDGFSGSFRTADEGWFGQNTYAGGADKAGHAYFTYTRPASSHAVRGDRERHRTRPAAGT